MTSPDIHDVTCCAPSCANPVQDARLCLRCTDTLERTLAETTWLVEQLQITTTREKATQLEGGGGRSAEKPLPFHIKASDVGTDLRTALTGLATRLPTSPPRWVKQDPTTLRYEPIDLSRWLLVSLESIRRNDYGGEVDAIIRTHQSAARIIDRPEEKVYAGPCECGSDLYAKKGAARASCRECERDYDVAEMQEWMRAKLADKLVTAAEGAGLLSRFAHQTDQKTIDKWAERKRIAAKSHDPRGRRLYLFSDLLKVSATAKRPA